MTNRQARLHTAHETRSLSTILEPGPVPGSYRFLFQLDNSPLPKMVEVPAGVLRPDLKPGAPTILTLTVTQIELSEVAEPAAAPILGLNGKPLS
jgi:hypothetical protein